MYRRKERRTCVSLFLRPPLTFTLKCTGALFQAWACGRDVLQFAFVGRGQCAPAVSFCICGPSAPRRGSLFMPPAAPFLPTAEEMGKRTPPKTHGFWISFRRFQCVLNRPKVESICFSARCRFCSEMRRCALLYFALPAAAGIVALPFHISGSFHLTPAAWNAPRTAQRAERGRIFKPQV